MKKLLKWLVILIGSPILLLAFALTVVSLLGINVNLDAIRPMVEKSASAALDRKVVITGSVELLPTLSPCLEVQGLRLDNPEGWGSEEFVTVKLVRIQLGLLDLLRKKINIDEITAEGVSVHLESREDDINNWSFTSSKKTSTLPLPEEASPATEDDTMALAFKAVDKLSLKNIEVNYKDVVLGKTISFQLDELSGKAPAGAAAVFHAEGRLQEQHYSFDLDAGALDTFRPRVKAWPMDLSGTMAGTPFSAKGDVRVQNDTRQLSLDVAIGAVDIGGLLSWLKVAENIKASSEDLSLNVQLIGDSLHELLEKSSFTFTLKGGTYDLTDSVTGSELMLRKLEGTIKAEPVSAIGVSLQGEIDTTPVNITIQGMPLVKYVSEPGELPVTISFAAAGAELNFSGALQLPVGSKTFTMAMHLQGEKLDSLNEFLNIDLPPFGPYSVDAQFAASESGYDLSNLGIKVGSSDLNGRLTLRNEEKKPKIIAQFTSKTLQLNDFELGDWSPEGKKDRVASEAEDIEQEAIEQEAIAEDKQAIEVPPFLSQESLSRVNASLSIDVSQVLSGKDTLGSGTLTAILEDGRFSIAPLQLELADGQAKLEFSFYPMETETEIHLATTINNLDLEIIAHRAKPDSTMGGILHLDVELDSTAPTLSELMAYGKGHFDLAFVPVNFDASVMDLWAVNLLSSLASEVDGEPKSMINCLVASFSMDEGLMQERAIFMDTTQMSIEGEANINFKTEELRVKMAPKAKKPEFFSMATPVKVQGSFEDFGIGINKLRLTTSIASFITSPVHVPLRRLFAGERPEDGIEACQAAWENRNVEIQKKSGVGD